MTDSICLLDELFHRAALAAGFIARAEGRLADSEYVKQLAYGFYEEDLARKNAAKDAPHDPDGQGHNQRKEST